MLKSLLVSVALVAGTSTLAMAAMQTGRSASETMEHPMMHHRMTHNNMRHHRVLANGHCNGKSYGTGQTSCGTATGGTPGGNPSRN